MLATLMPVPIPMMEPAPILLQNTTAWVIAFPITMVTGYVILLKSPAVPLLRHATMTATPPRTTDPVNGPLA